MAALSPIADTASDDKAVPPPAAHATVHHLAMRSHCHGSAGALPAVDAVRTASPLRRG